MKTVHLRDEAEGFFAYCRSNEKDDFNTTFIREVDCMRCLDVRIDALSTIAEYVVELLNQRSFLRRGEKK